MSTFRLSLFVTVVAVLSAPIPAVLAADVYYAKSIADLKITEGKLSDAEAGSTDSYRFWRRRQAMRPYIALDGPGEAYVGGIFIRGNAAPRHLPIVIRIPKPKKVTGRLYLPKKDFSGMVALKFSIPADQGDVKNRKRFLQSKRQHYQNLLSRGIPGSAWFRHQVRVTKKDLGLKESSGDGRPAFRSRGGSMEETYALISGGRALSENLQLDRVLPSTKTEVPTVSLDSIEGITVKEFDWAPRIKGLKPKKDRLAKRIPDDQYAIFLPSMQALIDLIDNTDEQSTLVLHAAEPRAEDARVRQRYERQLGLSMSRLGRLIGPHLIDSIAVTGSDPYLRTGADVAVLFDAKHPDALRKLLDAKVTLAASTCGDAKRIKDKIGGIAVTGFRSPDRSFCSYLATLGDAVVVTNSPAQLRRLISVFSGKTPSLDSLDEFTFFRDRYPLGDSQETGLLILSDKTIRRWCGPRWRIASSRQTRAAALMSELQATHFDRLAKGTVKTGPIYTDLSLPEAGDFTLAPSGVRSSTYGSLEFLTPIIELDFTHVTKREAQVYRRWRTGYQNNWSNFFDPIAVRFFASKEKLAIDVTVMPLIEFSDYREMIAISRGAKIGPQAGDPHAGTLAHGVFALNVKSPVVQQYAGFATLYASVNPLSWVGETVALYVDADPFWAELAKLDGPEKMEAFIEKNAYRFPIAANIEVRSSVKLVVFLTGLRTFIEQSGPGMTVWETKKYKEQSYVKVSPSEKAKSGDPWDKMSIYYAASGEALVVSINEDVLKRALDRQTARREAKQAGKPIPQTARPWLGENLSVTVDGGFIQLIQMSIRDQYQQQMQILAWSNLPALNQWHRLYGDQDPVKLHERLWHRRLVCPGGGEYRWNETWQTIESTVYGHPGQPKQGTSLPLALQSITAANFGLTFEKHGLRARAELQKKKPAKKK